MAKILPKSFFRQNYKELISKMPFTGAFLLSESQLIEYLCGDSHKISNFEIEKLSAWIIYEV